MGRYAPAILLTALLSAQQPQVRPDWQAALNRISADSLRGHVSFLASDLLEGRDTPSRGLNIAAEYIAAQFRRAGLEPGGDNGYYQTSTWLVSRANPAGMEFSIRTESQIIRPSAQEVALQALAVLDLSSAPVVKIKADDAELTPGQVEGKVVAAELPESIGNLRALRRFAQTIRRMKPSLIVLLDPGELLPRQARRLQLVQDRTNPASEPPAIVVRDPGVAKIFAPLAQGLTSITITARCSDPAKKVQLRNVIGVLRGSDPALNDTAVLVTAHYDHLGKLPPGNGDRIFNGANDDGSGTASVIELASALAGLPEKPKRSIVFLALFGEERGMLGSRYYVDHPLFPIRKTVAALNLEHLGRTDSSEGPQLLRAAVTGYDYSDIGPILKEAGEATGIRVYKHEPNSDTYFSRSDNIRFASRGVPADSVTTAFDFPDYHQVGDEWTKLDYRNMAKVDRMVALGLLMIADNPQAPKWNENNPKARRYLETWKKQRK